MPCEKGFLSPFLDGELHESDSRPLREHLDACAGCRRDLESLKSLSRLFAELPKRTPPEGFLERVRKSRHAPPLPARPHTPLLAPSRRLAAAGGLVLSLLILYNWSRPPRTHQPLLEDVAEELTVSLDVRDEASSAPIATLEPRKPRPEKTAYSKESMYKDLQEQTQRMGIAAVLGPNSIDPSDMEMPADPVLRREQIKAYMRQISSLRQFMGVSEPETVPVAGRTTPLLGWESSLGKASHQSSAVAAAESWSGPYSGSLEEGTRTISDWQAWTALWTGLSGEPVPAVDFAKNQVVGVFLGPRSTTGYTIEIREVVSTAAALVVRYEEKAPAADQAAGEAVTSPYAMRLVPQSELPVRYEKIAPARP